LEISYQYHVITILIPEEYFGNPMASSM